MWCCVVSCSGDCRGLLCLWPATSVQPVCPLLALHSATALCSCVWCRLDRSAAGAESSAFGDSCLCAWNVAATGTGAMDSPMKSMVRTALSGDPGALIKARQPGGVLYDGLLYSYTTPRVDRQPDPSLRWVQKLNLPVFVAFYQAVDEILGTSFNVATNRFDKEGMRFNISEVSNYMEAFERNYAQILTICYQRRNELTIGPGSVTTELAENVEMTQQLLQQTKSALQGADAAVEVARLGQPILAKLEDIEARMRAQEARMRAQEAKPTCCIL